MQFSFSSFVRSVLLALATISFLICAGETQAQPLELTLTPTGSAATGRPLPIGAMPTVKVSIHNPGKKPVGPVELTARFDGLAAGKPEDWRLEGRVLKITIREAPAGAKIERRLRFRIETAPIDAARITVTIEAKGPDGRVAEGAAELRVADCAGAYRSKLEALRPSLSQPVRDASDAIRRADPALPASRQFPPTGARRGDLARAERLAATFAARRGADPQMSTEWFRFLLNRWASELNAYAGQAANPGICANNYYQIAGYRQGLSPVTKHIDSIRAAAADAINAARKEMAMEITEIGEIVRLLIKSVELEATAENGSALSLLADARTLLREHNPDAATLRKFSVAETAAWLAEATRRGEKLNQAIEQVLSAIAHAHKESCVCAF